MAFRLTDSQDPGSHVTQLFESDDGRGVTVYVPPEAPVAVVFAGDGASVSKWGRYLESADVRGAGYSTDGDRTGSAAPCLPRGRTLEPFFLENATRWAVALRAGPSRVTWLAGGAAGAALSCCRKVLLQR